MNGLGGFIRAVAMACETGDFIRIGPFVRNTSTFITTSGTAIMNGALREGIRGELTDRFVCAIQQLNRLMHNGRIDELRKLDLNSPQANTLLFLHHHGPSRMGCMADFLGSKLPHMSIIVDHLVTKGYLRRGTDPKDRRVVICEFTADGKKAAEKIILHSRMRANKVANKWDFEKLTSVVETLESLWGAEEETPSLVITDKP